MYARCIYVSCTNERQSFMYILFSGLRSAVPISVEVERSTELRTRYRVYVAYSLLILSSMRSNLSLELEVGTRTEPPPAPPQSVFRKRYRVSVVLSRPMVVTKHVLHLIHDVCARCIYVSCTNERQSFMYILFSGLRSAVPISVEVERSTELRTRYRVYVAYSLLILSSMRSNLSLELEVGTRKEHCEAPCFSRKAYFGRVCAQLLPQSRAKVDLLGALKAARPGLARRLYAETDCTFRRPRSISCPGGEYG